jgi:hypothetical protein
MSYDWQQSGSSPPPAYSDSTPGGMENEVYIDGTLYVDGIPVSRGEQQRGSRKRNKENPCTGALGLVRSNI